MDDLQTQSPFFRSMTLPPGIRPATPPSSVSFHPTEVQNELPVFGSPVLRRAAR